MKTRMLGAALAALALVACGETAKSPPVVVATSAAVPAAAPESDHSAEILAWRETRVGKLRKPDGWLALVGLHWLSEGKQTVGAAADNAIMLATGPEHLGVITQDAGKIQFQPDAAAEGLHVQILQDEVWADAPAATAGYALEPDSGEHPGRILIGSDVSVALIERASKLALRVKDANAPTRSGFAGIDYFDIDPSWRIEATWTPNPTPQIFEIQTVLGTVDKMPNPGFASFSRDGKEYRLYPVLEEGEADWFFIFADRTNGRETYGPGRFFYAKPALDGKVILDFNKAYNPPCAFTEFSTCPLPPPENRLDLAVTAGEKKYSAHP